MKRPVIAIGLDAADPDLLDKWIAEGHLPTLKKLRENGTYARLHGDNRYKAETPWTNFLTACSAEKTGYWGEVVITEGTYDVLNVEAYDFKEYPPFYAVGPERRIAIFDTPKGTLSPDVNGPQVLAWGAHSPSTPSHSQPKEVFKDLERRYGKHPALHRDHGDWWDQSYIDRLRSALLTGIKNRTQICKEFLEQEEWDLFLTIFGEPHSAGHDFWFLSQEDHPLHECFRDRLPEKDPLLEVFQATDTALSEILEQAPDNAYVVVFSVHGSGSNTTDVPSMFMLAEFLYRWNFPGKALIAKGDMNKPPCPPLLKPRRKTWTGEVWQRREDPNPLRKLLRQNLPSKSHKYIDRFLGTASKPDMYSPQKLQQEKDPFFWQPVNWYKPFWSSMKAFALPSFSEGYVRINMKGREPEGIVDPADYNAVCDELEQELMSLVNPRNGRKVVKRVIRSRESGFDRNPRHPSADLVVEWAEVPADVIDHPTCGRIGPVPFRRTGSHRSKGFISIQGPGIEAGATLAEKDSLDVGPTILELMDVPTPEACDGRSVIERKTTAPAAI